MGFALAAKGAAGTKDPDADIPGWLRWLGFSHAPAQKIQAELDDFKKLPAEERAKQTLLSAAPLVAGMAAGSGLPKGVPADAKFAQKTFGRMFSEEGAFAGKSVEDLAAALRSGAMKPAQVEVNYVVRDGQAIILNTRSSQALEAAGIPRSQWNGVNRTGNSLYEGLLNGQLRRNPGGPFDTVRPSGTQ